MSDFLNRDSLSVWHPFTPKPSSGPRSVFVRGEGAYLFDESGKKFFDATSSWWCNLHGHCNPRLVSALSRQASQLDQILFAPHTHPIAVELAEELLKQLGQPFQRIFYSDDGSTAVEAALKMAVQYWHNRGENKRTRLLSLEMGYHGDTLGSVAISQISQYHHFFSSLLKPSLKAAAPYCYRCPVGLRYPSCEIACLESTEKLLDEHHDEIAALVVEPLIQGAAGMITYPKEYLEKIVSLCRNFGILIIFDEVFTGFGRTGTFFAFDQIKEKPDIVCLSKGLTSGMLPLAVTAASERVFEAFCGSTEKTFYHGHTFTANALGCAVALESLRILREDDVLNRNQKLIEVFAKFTPRFEPLPNVGQVRHLGMVWAVELVRNKSTKEIFEPPNLVGWRVAEKLWQKGVWIRPLHNMLYLVPPYCTQEDELQDVLQLLYSELQESEIFREQTNEF